MKVTVFAISWILTVAAVCVSVVLFWLARGNDPTAYSDSIAGVREIQQLAADWSVETARVRTTPKRD